MIPTIAFTPSWLEKTATGKPAKNPPVFHLRAGSILERDQFEAELDGRHRAGRVLGFQLLEAAIAGVEALVPGDDAAALTELLRSDFAGETLAPADRAQVAAVAEILTKSWPEFAACKQQESRRTAILPTLAFITWCAGWDNLTGDDGEPVVYARTALGELDDALLRRVPFTMMRAAGMEAYRLQYGAGQAKN
jgi:hypothetical protein